MQTINLNVTSGGIPPVLHCSQFDYRKPLGIELYDGDEAYTVPSGATVSVCGTKSDKHPFNYDSANDTDVVKCSGSIVTVYTTVQMTAAAGVATCELKIKTGSETLYTLNFILDVEAAALPQDSELSEIDVPLIIKAIETGQTVADIGEQIAKAQEILSDMDADVKAAAASQTAAAASETNAKTSETNAAASATTATNKATAAASSATKAANQATAAATSAKNAADSETNAAGSAKLAESWAVGVTGSRDGEDADNSKYYAEQSAASAAAAQKAADAAEHTDVGSLAKLVDAVEKAEATVEKNLTAVNHDESTYPAFVADRLANVTDLNDCITNGIYQFTAEASNNPVSAIGMVLVLNSTGSGETGYIAQYAWAASDAHTVYARDDHGGTWGEWKKLSADVDSALSSTSENPVQNKVVNAAISEISKNISAYSNVKTITISTSGWSSSTTTVNDSAYYTYKVTGLTIADENPDISIGVSGTLPTAAEQTAYECIKYAVASGSTLTLYADSKPTSAFVINVRGVA